MGWDKRGAVTCEVPAFAPASGTPNSTAGPIATPAPLPSPGAAVAKAVVTSAPFPVASCDAPFALPKLKVAVQPSQVHNISEAGNGPIISAVVLVAVDGSGHLLDAWLLASSGYAPADLAAMRSARLSTYSGGMSYCRPVAGIYALVVTFDSSQSPE